MEKPLLLEVSKRMLSKGPPVLKKTSFAHLQSEKTHFTWSEKSKSQPVLWHLKIHRQGAFLENCVSVCCNCFWAALDLQDFYGHWFPWFGHVMSKALDLPVSVKVLHLHCLRSSSRKMPGWVFSLSAWNVHGATINVSDVQYLKQPSQNADRLERCEMRAGI